MSNYKQANNIGERDMVLWVNIVLAGVILLLLFYYIIMANIVTVRNYKIQVLQDDLEVLAETNGALMAKKLALESSSSLIEFAKSRSLIEARNVLYIFENSGDVAKR